MKDRRFADLQRREFLMRCWGAAGASLIPPGKSWMAWAEEKHADDADYHFHPQYREKTPLDQALVQIGPGSDGFIAEQYHDRIAEILSHWSAGLLQSAQRIEAIETTLNESFAGAGWLPVESHGLRAGSKWLDMRRVTFARQASLNREAFLKELRASINGFSTISTAEFQITRVELRGSGGVSTQVRYELIGTGPDFYREQRSGELSLDWEPSAGNGYSLLRWQANDEIRSRAMQPFFADETERAFSGCPSYGWQMQHGADYWRTVLDGSCGIDIYGHNGISCGDIDGEGRDSIYVCQAAGLPNRLYRNRGDGTFEDITEASGLGLLDNTACALFADFDNDGRQDLVVVRANGPLLFLNQGKGKFRLKEGGFQFANPPQGTFTGAAAADYDRDGRLDIYFCVYTFYQGADQYRYPTPYFAAENGPPNFLMHNNGDGTFRDVTAQCGLNQNNTRYSFCCAWGDSNGNGWPDLYVVNDFGRKNLYRNNADGTFTDLAEKAGVEDVGAGMSVCWLNYENGNGREGVQDLYVANMWTAAGERITKDESFQREATPAIQALYRKHAMGNSLFQNTGGSAFRDVTERSGTEMGRWSWSSDAWDFDHDGFQDLYVANGMISGSVRKDLNSFFWRQVVAQSPNTAKSAPGYEQGWNAINELIRSGHTWSGYERNVLYANHRDGTFSDVSGTVGLDFPEDSRAFALADFDGDGRQELLLKNRSAPQLRLMKNVIPDLPPSIAFRLRGTKSNRDAIGARVTVESSAGSQTRLLQAGSGFLSQHSKELFFGLGEAKGSLSATIRWPSGLVQQLKDLPPNHRVSVYEGGEPTGIEPFKAATAKSVSPSRASGELLPQTIGTWLLTPLSAPELTLGDIEGKPLTLSSLRGKPVWLCFSIDRVKVPPRLQAILQRIVVDPRLRGSDDVCATYNLLFRYLFDQHRDLLMPTSFLVDEQGKIVKVYQGNIDPASVEKDVRNIPRNDTDRLAKALPFPGVRTSYEFGRNYLSLGSIFFQRGYIEAAGDFFQSASQIDPTSAEASYGLGSVYLRQQNNNRAIECFERAVKLKPAYPETGPNAWNNLGLLATREGETVKAVDCFEQALKLDPDHFITLQNLGSAYRAENRLDKAREVLERALAIKPENPEANYSLGMVYAQLDDPGRAYEYLQKALQARPEYPEALNNLGVLYLRTRRSDEAVATFQKCIRVAPAFDQSYLNLARVYAIEGDPEKARAVLKALLAADPDHAAARQALEQLK